MALFVTLLEQHLKLVVLAVLLLNEGLQVPAHPVAIQGIVSDEQVFIRKTVKKVPEFLPDVLSALRALLI